MSVKIKTGLEDAWDLHPNKLIVMILEGTDIGRGKALEGCQVKVVVERDGKSNKTIAKTKAVKTKAGVSHVEWNEIFFLSDISDADYLAIEVEDSRSMGSKNLGRQLVSQVQTIQPCDEVVDTEVLLNYKGEKPGEGVQGKIHVRLLYSSHPESVSRMEEPDPMKLTYNHFFDNFKTGDLISYGGHGIVSAVTRVVTNAPWSHCGIILRMPNRYTRRDELFVAEFGTNVDGLSDAFNNGKYQWGLNVFRLFERLHQFHGSSIWWSPLLIPVDEGRLQATLPWITTIYNFYKAANKNTKEAAKSFNDAFKKQDPNVLFFKANPARPFLASLVGEKNMNYADIAALASGYFVNELLVKLGIIRGDEYLGYPTPKRIVCLRCYGPPALIGARARYWTPSMLPETVKAAMVGVNDPNYKTTGSDTKRMDLARRILFSIGHNEGDLSAIMQVGGLFYRFKKGSPPSKVSLKLDEDESNIRVGSTTIAAMDILEVRIGQKTRAFEKSKKSAPYKGRSFSIMYGMRGKKGAKMDGNSIDVACRTKLEFDVWTSGIRMLLDRKHDPETAFIKAEFRKVKTHKHGTPELNIRQCSSILEKINFKAPKRLVKKKFVEMNTDGSEGLSYDEFVELLRSLRERPEIRQLFERYAENPEGGLAPRELQRFLHREQGETMVTENNCHVLVMKFSKAYKKAETLSLTESVVWTDTTMTFREFEDFLQSPLNSVLDVAQQRLTQDTRQPLSHYWINSSHNTYLEGHQLTGISSVEQYIRVLKSGCRCVELDCWDGDDGNPIIYHGHTFTTKISFEAVVKAVNDYAFYASDYPVIISIENHCSVSQQDRMADIFLAVFGDKIAAAKDRQATDIPGHLPSPEYLRGKILLKGKMLMTVDKALPAFTAAAAKRFKDKRSLVRKFTIRELADAAQQEETEIGETDGLSFLQSEEEKRLYTATLAAQESTKKEKISDKLSNLIYLKAVSYTSFSDAKSRKPWEMSSFSEGTTKSIAKNEAHKFVKYNLTNLSRIYPAGTRFASSNYNPYPSFTMGCQLVALNFQTLSNPMFMNFALFNQQERCGYILKPDNLRGLATTETNKFSELSVKIFSGRQLPKKKAFEEAEKSVIDPYVEISILGHSKDEKSYKTNVVKNNGYSPTWNELFRFSLCSSSTAVLLLQVLDAPNGRRLGWYALPVESIRPGFRIINFFDDSGREVPIASVFCHLNFGAPGLSLTSTKSSKKSLRRGSEGPLPSIPPPRRGSSSSNGGRPARPSTATSSHVRPPHTKSLPRTTHSHHLSHANSLPPLPPPTASHPNLRAPHYNSPPPHQHSASNPHFQQLPPAQDRRASGPPKLTRKPGKFI